VALYRDAPYSEAIEALDQSLQSGDDTAAGFDLIFLALCHSHLGNASVARDYYKRAIAWNERYQPRLSVPWHEELSNFFAVARAADLPMHALRN
jgi:tetratricopeptide (TPR) repeat protein